MSLIDFKGDTDNYIAMLCFTKSYSIKSPYIFFFSCGAFRHGWFQASNGYYLFLLTCLLSFCFMDHLHNLEVFSPSIVPKC